MTEAREERCEAGCIAYHGGERRHHPDCVFYPESFTKIHDDLARAHAELQAENARLQAALDAALAERLDRGEGLLDPEMPAAEIRLHMGEMSAQELRTARAAIGWANAVARGWPGPQDRKSLAAALAAKDAEIAELRGALENLLIAIGMGWDLDGVVEIARAALTGEKGK